VCCLSYGSGQTDRRTHHKTSHPSWVQSNADDDDDDVLGEGSDCGRSRQDQPSAAQLSSTSSSVSSSSSSSASDSDSDALMVSQELRPGFSSDKDVSSRHGVDDDTDASSEVLRQLNSNGSVVVAAE